MDFGEDGPHHDDEPDRNSYTFQREVNSARSGKNGRNVRTETPLSWTVSKACWMLGTNSPIMTPMTMHIRIAGVRRRSRRLSRFTRATVRVVRLCEQRCREYNISKIYSPVAETGEDASAFSFERLEVSVLGVAFGIGSVRDSSRTVATSIVARLRGYGIESCVLHETVRYYE